MLRRYAFNDGLLRYSNRFLRTDAYAEAMNGRLTGQFGTDTLGVGDVGPTELGGAVGAVNGTSRASLRELC